ncbi:MAG: response regulator [Patescibacteria group bacterium]
MKAPSIVLIVEDEASLRRALCDKFAREGFTVFEAKDGEVGLTLALKEEPNVILLDMMMPKVDGITMLHQLRLANEWGRLVPVLLLTNVSSDDKRMLREVQEDGSAHYLVKSDWPITRLVERVREALRETQNSI